MEMPANWVPSATLMRRTIIAILWTLVVWNSWQFRALYSDGAWFFVSLVRTHGFLDYNDIIENSLARQHAIVLSQVPIVLGFHAGVTDMHWLARLMSFGLFLLPTALYHLAIWRAKDDPLLLSLVFASIAMVFTTSSFFIVGEYNTAYALAIAASVTIFAQRERSILDPVILVALAVLALRTYEAMSYLGFLLAATIIWKSAHANNTPLRTLDPQSVPNEQTARYAHIAALTLVTLGAAYLLFLAYSLLGMFQGPLWLAAVVAPAVLAGWLLPVRRGPITYGLKLLTAALFGVAAVVAFQSLHQQTGTLLLDVAKATFGFVRNAQLDLMLISACLLIGAMIIKVDALHQSRLGTLKSISLFLLAVCPLLYVTGILPFPLGTLSYSSRTIGGYLVAIIICFMWLREISVSRWPAVEKRIKSPHAARCFLLHFFLMILAALPTEVLATLRWQSFIHDVRNTISSTSGVIAFESAPEALRKYYWNADKKYVAPLSLALRQAPDDGILKLNDDLYLSRLPELTGYTWRD